MSGRKNTLRPYLLIDGGDMSGDIESDPVNVQYLDNDGIEITWSGTPTGAIAVEGSVSGTNYYALTFDPALDQPAGSAGGYLINLNQFPYTYFRITYTATSGTGSLDVYITAKEI